ncbi:MAG TPA: glycerol-3-phosphate dehydrogenase/oxidase [Gaiellaceae bacterium]|nr:glycerol-3-phosphate dehydrogenase/oxidase [Gaiellaceae bacterium]
MGEPAAALSRERAAADLGARRFDLLVVGGGIIGAATAAHAARAGLAVALVEARDFGGATSSASSKLIHGGLRYLRLGDVRLVREAHRERRLLAGVVAPHLVRRISFLLPLYRGGPLHPWLVQTGIVLYSALARSRIRWLVAAERARSLVPPLRLDGLRSCALYADATTNDARLCLENVRAAAGAGAVVLNGAEVVEVRTLRGRVAGATVRVDGADVAVEARCLVNAAGPWVDDVRRLEDPRAGASVRLSRGAHVLLPLEDAWGAALTIAQDEVRVTFAVPWSGMLLLGTTDDPYEGDPAAVAVEPGDAKRILAEAAVALDEGLLRPERVRAAYAGLRVLPAGPGESVRARRETVIAASRGGMLTVAGGKLTTYRRIALEVLRRLRADLGLRRVDERPWPLPGAAGLGRVELPVEVEPDVREHLLHLYGGLAAEVLAPAVDDPALLERLHPGGPDIAAQVRYAATHEWARGAEDVLRRRTTLFYRGLADEETAGRVERLLVAARRAAAA